MSSYAVLIGLLSAPVVFFAVSLIVMAQQKTVEQILRGSQATLPCALVLVVVSNLLVIIIGPDLPNPGSLLAIQQTLSLGIAAKLCWAQFSQVKRHRDGNRQQIDVGRAAGIEVDDLLPPGRRKH